MLFRSLDALVAGSDSFSKEQLFEVKSKIEDYSCPAELKMPYIYNIENKIQEIAKKEIDGICGNISTLSTKKSLDAIVKIRALSIDEELKNQYLDSIEAHIMEIKNNEQRNYISYLKQKISEFNVSTVNFLVPTVSNLFYPKFDEASKHYVSAGRYELPIFLHDNSSDNGFTLTTEYFYFINKGVFNRIKIDDIVSFQAKKNFVNTSIVVSERNGNTNEIPCSINKNSIDATAKAMTALVNYIRDQRSAERMQELLENAVHERTQEIEIAAVKAAAENITATPLVAANAPAPEVQPSVEPDNVVEPDNAAEEPSEDNAEELTPPTPIPSETPKIRFCDQCGAKIASATAKFCAECGNKLF